MSALVIEDLSKTQCESIFAMNVIDLTKRLAARGDKPRISDDEIIKSAVAKRLGGHPNLVPAQHRAVNNFHGEISKEESIQRAVVWAECSFGDDDGPRAA